MDHSLLTLSQALQLAALIPCLFVAIYLLLPQHHMSWNILPVCYFLALGANFMLPLLLPLSGIATNDTSYLTLHIFAGIAPALSYLLILQCVLGHPPARGHFLVLGAPLVGGTPFIYAADSFKEVCFAEDICLPSDAVLLLYQIGIYGFIFILLTVTMSRYIQAGQGVIGGTQKSAKYWLVIAIIMVNICILGLTLLRVAGIISQSGYVFSQAMLQITFVYLIISSIFRVFTKAFAVKPIKPLIPSLREKSLALKLKTLLEDEHIYREPQCNRLRLSEALGLTEAQISQLVNRHFNVSITDLINDYRIRDAKHRLSLSESPITGIAFDVGFNSLASFNRVFKEKTLYAPSEYREQSQKSLP
ncbi:MAG: bacterial regulatory helix-turn-helix s, AraC family protein [Rickettsiales bacterium]|jgi:AraC-like DNA-binding protein|nr:bacterial regulatory helix-turn-helix s, AraC family protein [Rickettsiales bacterium]